MAVLAHLEVKSDPHLLDHPLPRAHDSRLADSPLSPQADRPSLNPVIVPLEQLSPQLIDCLTDQQQDWIAQLHPDWQVESGHLTLLGTNDKHSTVIHAPATVMEVVALTHSVSYRSLQIASHWHWIHTCCLSIAGLGRVRLLICFDDATRTDTPTLCATNRLDWTPRSILTAWMQVTEPAAVQEIDDDSE